MLNRKHVTIEVLHGRSIHKIISAPTLPNKYLTYPPSFGFSWLMAAWQPADSGWQDSMGPFPVSTMHTPAPWWGSGEFKDVDSTYLQPSLSHHMPSWFLHPISNLHPYEPLKPASPRSRLEVHACLARSLSGQPDLSRCNLGTTGWALHRSNASRILTALHRPNKITVYRCPPFPVSVIQFIYQATSPCVPSTSTHRTPSKTNLITRISQSSQGSKSHTVSLTQPNSSLKFIDSIEKSLGYSSQLLKRLFWTYQSPWSRWISWKEPLKASLQRPPVIKLWEKKNFLLDG